MPPLGVSPAGFLPDDRRVFAGHHYDIMYSRLTAADLATRVRSLIGGDGPSEVHEAALELGVSERDLVEIVKFETRYPASAVLAALVAYHGVDAGWLLTGEYSPSLHRATVEASETSRSVVDRLLRDVATGQAD